MADEPIVGSLFAGIGGFDLGFERAGWRTTWFCESEPFCQHILRRHWPGVPVYDDVRDLDAGRAESVDVLCGGFPCQDLSVAGRGEGLSGARSGLWSEYRRLIGEFRPRYVVVENVSALLARGLGVVLGDLAALGYDAEWDCLPASAFGARHQRDRIWLVAYPQRDALREQSGRGDGPHGAGPREPGDDGSQQHLPDAQLTRLEGLQVARPTQVAEPGHRRADVADTAGLGRQRSRDTRRWRPRPAHSSRHVADPEPAGPQGDAWSRREGSRGPSGLLAELDRIWAAEPDVGRVADGVPARVDRIKALGNALVPQIAEAIAHRINAYEAHSVLTDF